MSKKRREYDEAYKDAALKRIEAGEKVAAVARELKVNDSVIYGWIRVKREMTEPKQKPDTVNNVRDAIVSLKQAEDMLNKRIRAGKLKKYDRIHLRMLDALKTLTGED